MKKQKRFQYLKVKNTVGISKTYEGEFYIILRTNYKLN